MTLNCNVFHRRNRSKGPAINVEDGMASKECKNLYTYTAFAACLLVVVVSIPAAGS